MKATDLMLGDWVLYHGKPARVRSIHDNVLIDGDDELVDIVFPDRTTMQSIDPIYLEPIPLTAKILEKNGFIKDAYKEDRLTDAYHLLVPTGFERNSFTIQVSLYKRPICGVSTLVKCWGFILPYNGGMNDIHLCSANYVHQLQNALRLCTIEKEIII